MLRSREGLVVKRLALAALAAALLLVGCSDDDSPEPRIAPTDTSSAASTPTTPAPTASGPVEPTMPAAAEGDDAAAAEAFVEFYWEVANYAQETGDTEALARWSAKSCVGCRAAIDLVNDVYGSGGHIRGGLASVSIVSSRELRAGERDLYEVVFDVVNSRQTLDRPGDSEDEVYPASTVRDRFLMIDEGGEMRVIRWELVS